MWTRLALTMVGYQSLIEYISSTFLSLHLLSPWSTACFYFGRGLSLVWDRGGTVYHTYIHIYILYFCKHFLTAGTPLFLYFVYVIIRLGCTARRHRHVPLTPSGSNTLVAISTSTNMSVARRPSSLNAIRLGCIHRMHRMNLSQSLGYQGPDFSTHSPRDGKLKREVAADIVSFMVGEITMTTTRFSHAYPGNVCMYVCI